MRVAWPAPAVALTLALAPLPLTAAVSDLTELTIEELSNLEVTSVSRRPESLAAAPASIYVITGQQIRRSGAVTIPEVLRLAPNLQVARIDAREYAISARGFQSGIANKLLVLIDGRTVYTPLFSGVFWDAQDLVLEDIERIEVISGPGAATWGVNAVNGVINITTRSAGETQGTLATGGVGHLESVAALRHGGQVGDRGFFRVYGKGFRGQANERVDGNAGFDRWQRGQIGFRADWNAGSDDLTVQGDLYRAYSEERRGGPGLDDLSGGNLLARWTREHERGGGLELQAYYDQSDRAEVLPLGGRLFDVAFRQALSPGVHKLTWGTGYRYAEDESERVPEVGFIPARRNLRWYHVFGQDQFALARNLEATLGLRFENNVYTDWEVLPSVRLAWAPGNDRLIWGALSRAIRAPARLDREVFIPASPPFVVGGGPDFESETADVVEIGYRAQPTTALLYSLTAFHHRFDRLRSLELAPAGSEAATIIGNGFKGEITGVEGWGAWQVTDGWQLRLGGFAMDQDLRPRPGSTDMTGPRTLGNDANYQLQLRSTFDLTLRHQVDVMLRHVDDLPDPDVPSYTAVDMRLGWKFAPGLDLSLLLQNLFDSSHGEFGAAPERTEFDRAAFVRLTWSP